MAPGAISSVRWVIVGSIAHRLTAIVGIGAIARLASQETYGAYREIVAMHFVVCALLPLGFSELVIREKSSREKYIRGLQGAVFASAVVLAAGIFIFHFQIAKCLSIVAYERLLWVFPAIFLVQALKLAIKPCLVAEMAFKRISSGEALHSLACMFGGAGALAFWDNPASLYAAYGAAEIIELWWLYRGRDFASFFRLGESMPIFVELLKKHRRFCSVVSVDQTLNVLSLNAPVLTLGVLLGQEAVGAFAMANALISMPVLLITGAIGRVAFPDMAGRPEHDLRQRAILTLRASAAFVAPVLLWLAFFSPILVTVVLGERWTPDAAPLLRWLALYLVFRGLFSPISSLDYLRDRPDLGLAWNSTTLVLRFGALSWGALFSVEAAVAAFSVVSAIMWLVFGALEAWLLGVECWRFFKEWMVFIPFWAALAAALWAALSIPGIPEWQAAIVSAPALAIYGYAIHRLDGELSSLAFGFLGLKRKAGSK